MLSLCLIEDTKKLGEMIHESLNDLGYACDCYTSVEAFPLEHISKYHIFILDVNLPGMNGFEFAKIVRQSSRAGIIFLTANGTLDDKTVGFEVGADDYITKPFAIKELIFRIESLSKRISKTCYFTFNDLYIDTLNQKITKKNTSIHLTPTERQVLQFLIENIGAVCQRTDIIDHVRGYDAMFSMSRSLDVTIAHLRNKLDKSLIQTVAGVGYSIQHHTM